MTDELVKNEPVTRRWTDALGNVFVVTIDPYMGSVVVNDNTYSVADLAFEEVRDD